MQEYIKTTLVTAGIIAAVVLGVLSMYVIVIMGVPIGIWYLVHQYSKIKG